MPKPVKRKYSSPNRAAQAASTRAAITEAARRLFTSHGYVATTVQAIADEAGVAGQTVYAVFGNKRELLRQVLESAVSGGPDEWADQLQAITAERDPRRRVELDAAISTQIAKRVAPIMRVLREAASADPEFAATMTQITDERRKEMRAAAQALAGADGLKIPLDEAVATLFVLYNPEVFTTLTTEFGWSEKRYERWLATALYRSLLA